MNKLTEDFFNLVKHFEGLELKEYIDSAGVRTIGYGHTNMTGNPPKVVPGLTITKEEAQKILEVDLVKYSNHVKRTVKVPLNSNQYGALVSFCYNVGPGNFSKSSVLRMVNAGRFDDVPSRLLRWNKAKNPKTGKLRVLRGLTRRRKAEGVLFLTPVGITETEVERQYDRDFKEQRNVEVAPESKPITNSTTIWATLIGYVTSILTALEGLDTVIALSVIGLSTAVAGYIIWERWKKKRDGLD